MSMEIERKYLIRMPDEAKFWQMPHCTVWEIVQTYLYDGGVGQTRRVRSIRTGSETHYIYTAKRRVNELTCEEHEREISEADYKLRLLEANPELRSIEKRRYRIPHAGQLMEIDIYSFWDDRATLEIELEREDQVPDLPEWLEVIRDVTGERAYKNRYLAESVPMEDIQ